jgi:hypothetical protein
MPMMNYRHRALLRLLLALISSMIGNVVTESGHSITVR